MPISEDNTNLIKEINILKECQNDFIVKYYGSYMYKQIIKILRIKLYLDWIIFCGL